MQPKPQQNQVAFTTVSLLLLFSAIIIVVAVNVADEFHLDAFGIAVARAMTLYLVFVAVRTGLLLVFSALDQLLEQRLPEPNYYPMVTILVPCFNEEAVLAEALRSIMELDYPNYEVLVIDDGSFDMTTEVAKRFEENHRLRVVYQENAGKAAALNRGLQEAAGDFVLCMDADSVLAKEVLLRAMPYFESDPTLGAVAGSVLIGNERSSLLAAFQKLEYIVGLNFQKRAQSFFGLVTIVPGPIGVFRREAATSIGGYHTDTFAEDCDLSMRLLTAGWRIKYCSKMTALTEAPIEIQSLLVQRYRWSRGMIQAISKQAAGLLNNPFDLRAWLVTSYMFVETVIIPSSNCAFAMLTLTYALTHEVSGLFGPYFISLTALDMTVAIYSIIFERQALSLFILSVFNRFTYGFMLEVTRFFSILDEILKIPMKWGTIPRRGLG